MKVVLIVLDSFGVGALPDAHKFSDEGSNTYLNIYNKTKVDLPNLAALGLNNIEGINLSSQKTIGKYGRMKELTPAKDTTAGHYEICGLVLEHPYPTFPNGFPKELMDKLESKLNVKFIGNEVASGTEIIKRLGQEHLKTASPIVYTSADSVLQIATHTDKFSVEELYDICEKAREICCGKYSVGRIIARPFATNERGDFYRLEARKDYALEPPKPTLLDKLKENDFDVVAIGKIEDIFCNRGLTESYHSRNNQQGIEELKKHTKRKDINGLVFANLNDTDMLFGHRNDYVGYANALKEFDNCLPEIMDNLQDEDILIITADHGCDPTTPSTDHSREYVPILIYSKSIAGNINLGTLNGFNNISNSILDLFKIENHKNSLFKLRSFIMPTVHNSAEKEDIAKTVIMPGDPLRSKFIAENFLENAKLVNNVRGIQGYTGTYHGKKVTVMASGMGCPTMGIYSYELFKFYDVEKIIRIGSIGSLSKDIKLKDLIIVENSYSNTNYDNFYVKNGGEGYISGSKELALQASKIAEEKNIRHHMGDVLCSDTFYSDSDDNQKAINLGLLGVEMESAALYLNARKLNKKALCICTVSDNIITNEQTSSDERQTAFTDMMHVALELA